MITAYKEIKNEITEETVIERSRFICSLKKAENEAQAREIIAEIRKKHPFATHNCYAYVTDGGAIARFSDDGEPQGTAGQPMLEVIKNNGTVNVAAVVTRYFGGIKLGAGGLARAYGGAVASAIKRCGVSEFFLSDVFNLTFNYDAYAHFLKFSQNKPIIALSTDFAESVKITACVKQPSGGLIDELTDLLNGKIEITEVRKGFFAYE